MLVYHMYIHCLEGLSCVLYVYTRDTAYPGDNYEFACCPERIAGSVAACGANLACTGGAGGRFPEYATCGIFYLISLFLVEEAGTFQPGFPVICNNLFF